MSQAQPRLTLLSEEQKKQIHNWSLQVLANPGVRVTSQKAKQLLARALSQNLADERVRIPAELVTWALATAPHMIAIHDRLGRPAFTLGPEAAGGVRFGIGVTNLYYQDPETDAVVPFTREHMALSARLGHGLTSYDVVSTVGILRDVPDKIADLVAALEMAANTTKPLVILVSRAESLPGVFDLLEHLCGDLGARPFAIPYASPITPLTVDQGAFTRMEAAIGRGLPLIYSNYGMAGATTPITAAGTLALLNAELLAGLVLAQLIRPGAPVILGSLPASFDMKAMMTYYGTQTMLLNLACAEMMAYYGLPHCGTSGSGSGWGPDLLAGDLLWMNHLTSCLGSVGLAPFVGGNFDSLAFSPAMVVHADEVIRQARAFAGGLALEEELVGLDEIAQVGPDGNFLMADLTLRKLRDAEYRSPIAPRLTLEAWQEAGAPRSDLLLRKRTTELIDSLPAPADHDELLDEGELLIQTIA